ncbi:phosphohydrolase [Weizmannia acidilactici]|uniref:Phosphohydrolase n=1 Tax=Weizmannia acidilactici TaxID=2607726 RepID=A0A5J4JK46_9BACI|nr:HD domain-containing protein [Weizmannia acidilactici]GER65728.1 phosphohydrolase [Weizmannia acidilactici]GER71579.1 phosphohydrolase [Weizmannia acidilactici]GER72084.1 phosphohydrolase [Weizmannia acidilactici]
MQGNSILIHIEQFARTFHSGDASGHDWHHIDRVRRLALYIAEKEGKGDRFIIEAAALLHDIPDEKMHAGKKEGEEILHRFLGGLPLVEETKKHIAEIVFSISFKGGNEAELTSFEAMAVRDADRLDAIGAIGIARAFAYGGKKGQPLYEPALPVRSAMTVVEYRNGKTSSIHHFYEKLLLLKDRLHTETAKSLAEERHRFMKQFLQHFYKEWNVGQ